MALPVTSGIASVNESDVLMISKGGKAIQNIMDLEEAGQAVRIMQPKQVIPCHYNCQTFFIRTYNPADGQLFKREVEKTGAKCAIIGIGESTHLNDD